MKIAIIGFGWLGFPLGKTFRKAGHQVVGTTTTQKKIALLKESGLDAIQMDLTKDLPQDSSLFFKNCDVCILNFPPGRNSDPQGREIEIENYGKNALKAVELFPAHTRFIFVSSTGVYPDTISNAKEGDFDRTKLIKSNSMAFAEETLHLKLGDRLTIVRMSGLIGEDRHIGKHFAGRKNIPNGDTPVNLIHLADCIRLIERIIELNYWGETFNGCASEHPSRRDYYTFYCKHFGLELPEFPEESNPVIGKRIDNSKSKEMLEFEYTFDDPYQMLN